MRIALRLLAAALMVGAIFVTVSTVVWLHDLRTAGWYACHIQQDSGSGALIDGMQHT